VGCFESVFAVEGFDGFESVHIENGGNGFGDEALIVDDEDAQASAAAGFGGNPGPLGKGAGLVV
jgi:hypothetical protein